MFYKSIYNDFLKISCFADSLIKYGVNGLKKRTTGLESITKDERTFLYGLKLNDYAISFALECLKVLNYHQDIREELLRRSNLLIKSTIMGFETLRKDQKYISDEVIERFAQFNKKYSFIRQSIKKN